MKGNFSSKLWWYIVLIVYATIVGIAISKHEPWFDEAQAWLLVRDLNPLDLFTKFLRYEGTPGLWYAFLVIPSKLGLPYFTMNIISGILAVISVYIFLRYSPFPVVVKILLPFSFFIFFQYAVVARSYVLLPLLLFLIASIYKNKTKHVYLFMACLCLLANVSVHGFLIALSIAFIHLIDLIKERNSLDKYLKIRQGKAYLLFLLVVIAIVLQIWPAEDGTFVTAYNFNIEHFFATIKMMINNSFTESISISTIVFIVTLFWFLRKRLLLLYLLTILPLLIVSSVIYFNVWHEGTFFLVWIFVMWISFEVPDNNHDIKNMITSIEKNIVVISLMIVLSFHIYWSFNSMKNDFYENYSGSYDVAQYIKSNHLAKKKIYATSFHSISILPYFDGNIFDNYNFKYKPCFWLWSKENTMIQDFETIIKERPDVIILGIKFPSQEQIPVIPDYKFIGMFDGNIYWKDRILEKDSFALFRLEQI